MAAQHTTHIVLFMEPHLLVCSKTSANFAVQSARHGRAATALAISLAGKDTRPCTNNTVGGFTAYRIYTQRDCKVDALQSAQLPDAAVRPDKLDDTASYFQAVCQKGQQTTQKLAKSANAVAWAHMPVDMLPGPSESKRVHQLYGRT